MRRRWSTKQCVWLGPREHLCSRKQRLANANPDGHSNSYAYTDSYAYGHSNSYSHADSYANGDSNSYAYTDSHANRNS
jgi:hypothetical protein